MMKPEWVCIRFLTGFTRFLPDILSRGGYVNKQNCRVSSLENPKVIIEKPLYPQRVTAWCGFWAAGSLGLILLKIKLERLFRRMDCATEP